MTESAVSAPGASPARADDGEAAATPVGDGPGGDPAGASPEHASGAPPRPATAGGDGQGEGGRRDRFVLAGLIAVVTLPLLIAGIAQRSPTWYPSVDLSLIALKVRDVGLDHPPLVGLGGRLRGFGVSGSHPGPIAFYALAPLYRLLGSTSWALQMSAAVVNAVAVGLAVWLGHRRWGVAGAAVTAGALGLVMRAYGTEIITVPWNPNFPVLWWPVVLLAVWSVLDDDLVALPVAVLAGSMAAQTHIPYVALVGGLGGLAVAWLVVRAWRHPEARRSILRWSAAAGAFALLLWLPPIVEQLRNHPGNISIIIENFRHPYDEPVALGEARTLWLTRLAPQQLFTGTRFASETATVGMLVLWLASVGVAVRLRHGRLLRLHLVTGVAVALGFMSISRIFGAPWPYLTHWLRGTIALVVGAVVATLAVAVARLVAAPAAAGAPGGSQVAAEASDASDASGGAGADGAGTDVAGADPAGTDPAGGDASDGAGAGPIRRSRGAAVPGWAVPRWAVPALLVAVALVPAALFAGDAAEAKLVDPEFSTAMGAVLPDTADALDRDDTYLVSVGDPVGLGGAGFTTVLYLDRHGFDARVLDSQYYRHGLGAHRVVSPDDADAEIHVSVGDADIALWDTMATARRVGYFDPRTEEEQATAIDLQQTIVDELDDRGLADLADTFRSVRMAAVIDERFPDDLAGLVGLLNTLPPPTATFLSTTPGERPEVPS